jgi:hypothetical protein
MTAGGAIGLGNIIGYGLSNEAGTASGTISGNSATFTFSAPTVGSGSGTISGNTISGSGTVTGALNFGAFTYIGTLDVTGTNINGTFSFTAPGSGYGIATVTKI